MLKCIDGKWNDILIHQDTADGVMMEAEIEIYAIIHTKMDEHGGLIDGVPSYVGVTLCLHDGDNGRIKFRFGEHAHDCELSDSMSIDLEGEHQSKYVSFYNNHTVIRALQLALELHEQILDELIDYTIAEICEPMEVTDDI